MKEQKEIVVICPFLIDI